ncbi:hypothetical protein C9374_010241 [Naegleria lovaniensis]|uniref:RGS domain-containing protein n=1 Tax=Naegleria lovaniensis TaxID=51637 RepID=A0AA88GC28_NAELO|nr:uncharacterized protein C9374_010241 [Naegleria lovaniensis]KAG2374867.1 hypothetical protein C9374_010241 [Naegleria lovaniensis]
MKEHHNSYHQHSHAPQQGHDFSTTTSVLLSSRMNIKDILNHSQFREYCKQSSYSCEELVDLWMDLDRFLHSFNNETSPMSLKSKCSQLKTAHEILNQYFIEGSIELSPEMLEQVVQSVTLNHVQSMTVIFSQIQQMIENELNHLPDLLNGFLNVTQQNVKLNSIPESLVVSLGAISNDDTNNRLLLNDNDMTLHDSNEKNHIPILISDNIKYRPIVPSTSDIKTDDNHEKSQQVINESILEHAEVHGKSQTTCKTTLQDTTIVTTETTPKKSSKTNSPSLIRRVERTDKCIHVYGRSPTQRTPPHQQHSHFDYSLYEEYDLVHEENKTPFKLNTSSGSKGEKELNLKTPLSSNISNETNETPTVESEPIENTLKDNNYRSDVRAIVADIDSNYIRSHGEKEQLIQVLCCEVSINLLYQRIPIISQTSIEGIFEMSRKLFHLKDYRNDEDSFVMQICSILNRCDRYSAHLQMDHEIKLNDSFSDLSALFDRKDSSTPTCWLVKAYKTQDLNNDHDTYTCSSPSIFEFIIIFYDGHESYCLFNTYERPCNKKRGMRCCVTYFHDYPAMKTFFEENNFEWNRSEQSIDENSTSEYTCSPQVEVNSTRETSRSATVIQQVLSFTRKAPNIIPTQFNYRVSSIPPQQDTWKRLEEQLQSMDLVQTNRLNDLMIQMNSTIQEQQHFSQSLVERLDRMEKEMKELWTLHHDSAIQNIFQPLPLATTCEEVHEISCHESTKFNSKDHIESESIIKEHPESLACEASFHAEQTEMTIQEGREENSNQQQQPKDGMEVHDEMKLPTIIDIVTNNHTISNTTSFNSTTLRYENILNIIEQITSNPMHRELVDRMNTLESYSFENMANIKQFVHQEQEARLTMFEHVQCKLSSLEEQFKQLLDTFHQRNDTSFMTIRMNEKEMTKEHSHGSMNMVDDSNTHKNHSVHSIIPIHEEISIEIEPQMKTELNDTSNQVSQEPTDSALQQFCEIQNRLTSMEQQFQQMATMSTFESLKSDCEHRFSEQLQHKYEELTNRMTSIEIRNIESSQQVMKLVGDLEDSLLQRMSNLQVVKEHENSNPPHEDDSTSLSNNCESCTIPDHSRMSDLTMFSNFMSDVMNLMELFKKDMNEKISLLSSNHIDEHQLYEKIVNNVLRQCQHHCDQYHREQFETMYSKIVQDVNHTLDEKKQEIHLLKEKQQEIHKRFEYFEKKEKELQNKLRNLLIRERDFVENHRSIPLESTPHMDTNMDTGKENSSPFTDSHGMLLRQIQHYHLQEKSVETLEEKMHEEFKKSFLLRTPISLFEREEGIMQDDAHGDTHCDIDPSLSSSTTADEKPHEELYEDIIPSPFRKYIKKL